MDVWPTLDDAVTMDTGTNPFQQPAAPQTNGSEPTYQKANLLLDLAGGDNYAKLNASSPSETDLYFLNRPANGKGEANYEDDDFGPETDVDAVDDVLLSPAIAAAARAAAAVATTVDVHQQLGRDETPTPPADEVTGGPPLLPESENVAESGEESEDEWNYYRVEPTEKPVETQQQQQQPAEKTAEEKTKEEEEEDEASMESRLNPNAAEFVPSPTATKPSMEELLSESPRKGGVVMDDVHMPSPVEFRDEVSLRPSELDFNPFAQSDVSRNLLPDLLNGKTEVDSNEKNPYQILENESDFGELTEPINPFKSSDHLFDKSEVSSTKAEFGDETATSFLDNVSDGDYLKEGNVDSSDCMDLNASMTESDFVAANLSDDVTGKEPSKSHNGFAPTQLTDDLNMCFEQQKDFVPSFESEICQVRTGNENLSFEVNSTTLDQELGIVDSVLPASVDFQLDVANLSQEKAPVLPVFDSNLDFVDPPQASVEASSSPTLHNASVSNSALSLGKEAFDLVMDFTEELGVNALPSTPLSSDVHVSSVCSGIENIDLEPNVTNLAQLETELVPSVNAEPVISELSNFVGFEPQMLLPTQSTEPRILEEHNLPSLFPSQESVLPKELISEPQVEEPALMNIESKQDQEVSKAEDISMVSDIISQSETVVAAASVAAVATAAMAVEAAVSGKTNDIAEKAKPSSGKATPMSKSATLTQKTLSKTPTSPTKPLAPTSRSTTSPKKPLPTATSRVASKTTTASKVTTTTGKTTPSSTVTSKVTATTTSQVRVKVAASSPTKPAPAAKAAPPTKTTAPARPRPATATKAPVPEKKPPGLTNGEAKSSSAKRPELAPAAKRLPTTSTTTRPLPRPASAPVAAKTITKTTSSSRTVTSSTTAAAPRPITKPAVNGVAKPKTTTTTTASTLRAKPAAKTVDKQVKDSANKQISSVGAKTSTVSRAATTARKPSGGATKTTTTTTVTKSCNTGPIRRPPGTVVTKTTSEIITVAPTETTVVVEEFATTTVTKDDDSPILDNAQIEVGLISITD